MAKNPSQPPSKSGVIPGIPSGEPRTAPGIVPGTPEDTRDPDAGKASRPPRS